MKANRMNILLWISLVLLILICFHFFSDGDFSCLLVENRQANFHI